MKRICVITVALIAILLFRTNSYAVEEIDNNEMLKEQEQEYGISGFISESSKYSDEINLSKIFEEGLSGNIDNNKILNIVFSILGDNLKNSLFTLSGIIIIVIINSILKSISENLGNSSVSKIAYFTQYILIVTLIMKNFSDIINSVKTAVGDLAGFAYTLIPLLTSLMVATGNITTSSMIEPILLSMVGFISAFITNVVIPLVLVATALGIVSKLSDEVHIAKLSKLINKGSVWVLTTVLAIFIGLASLESGLTSGVDDITKKAGKSIISASVPVVGGILGDAIDTIVGYSNIIKNATGLVGIVVVLCICLKPIISLTTLTIAYKLSSALCEPIAEKKVTELIEQMANTFKVLLAVMFTITVMIIIGLAIVIKVTG